MKSGSALFRASQATMTVSISVFLYEGFAYNIIYLGRILPAVGKQALILPFAIFFNVIWGLAIWSYVRAHFSDPGRVPEKWRDFVRAIGDALPVVPARPEWQPGKATYCKKCDLPRPERAHHCLLCEVCVLRMDHHCPWINNCVGYRNHKFFLLLGTYACLASFAALATSLPELVHCAGALTRIQDGFVWEPGAVASFAQHEGYISNGGKLLEQNMTVAEARVTCSKLPTCKGFTFRGAYDGDESKVRDIYLKNHWDVFADSSHPWVSFRRMSDEVAPPKRLEVTDILVFLIFGILALFVAVLLTPMLATHVPLAMRNLTTIEDNYENMRNPFDQGSTTANLAQVMGAPGVDWLVPIDPWKPLSDGISFARSDERLEPDGSSELEDGEDVKPEMLWKMRYRVRRRVADVQEEASDGWLGSYVTRWWNG